MTAPTTLASVSPSPRKRAWLRFQRNRLGFYSLVVLCVLFAISLAAELVSNDKPLLARYNGQWYAPFVQQVPETALGGDFQTNADYLDPFVREQFA